MDGLIGLFQGGGTGRVIVVENMVMAAKSLQGKVGLFEQGGAGPGAWSALEF